ncbi:PqqD family protein [Marinihelvus fidelis]|uniref:PqqD family protein n=1 Tax=Marinihelvus fidelis TaxID=2613842 RepID=A0A5N0TD97_9GAMM|nr:PqqD family protein [Marinihelvus fidelis]
MNSLNLTARYGVAPTVRTQSVHDELVILDLAEGEYYGLDPVGARFWALLETGVTVAEALDSLFDVFDVGRQQLEADIARLLEDLTAKALLLARD